MEQRRVHSSIDKLPDDLRKALTLMVVDNDWPSDWTGTHFVGNPRYEDLSVYAFQKGFQISESAAGRFGKRLRILSRMKQAGTIVRDVMKDLTAENASQTQKAVAEMITAQTIDFISSQDELDAKEIKNIAQAMRDCTQVSINADKYIRSQLAEKAKTVAKTTAEKLKDSGIDRKKVQIIIDEILGIAKS